MNYTASVRVPFRSRVELVLNLSQAQTWSVPPRKFGATTAKIGPEANLQCAGREPDLDQANPTLAEPPNFLRLGQI